jgi:Asp-tRNA(Asn)/Glu-tRNA(Gln) amidotransferase C subunit
MPDDDDDDNDDYNKVNANLIKDVEEKMKEMVLQLDDIISLLQTIDSANPESQEYKSAIEYITPAFQELFYTMGEFLAAVEFADIDERQKERLSALVDEFRQYSQQMQTGEISLRGFIDKLVEFKNTVEKMIEPVETHSTLVTQLNEIIATLEKFKQVKNGDALALVMDHFESKWKPVVKLVADEWSLLESFIELPTMQFINPRNKEKFNQIIDTIIAKIKSSV